MNYRVFEILQSPADDDYNDYCIIEMMTLMITIMVETNVMMMRDK